MRNKWRLMPSNPMDAPPSYDSIDDKKKYPKSKSRLKHEGERLLWRLRINDAK